MRFAQLAAPGPPRLGLTLPLVNECFVEPLGPNVLRLLTRHEAPHLTVLPAIPAGDMGQQILDGPAVQEGFVGQLPPIRCRS